MGSPSRKVPRTVLTSPSDQGHSRPCRHAVPTVSPSKVGNDSDAIVRAEAVPVKSGGDRGWTGMMSNSRPNSCGWIGKAQANVGEALDLLEARSRASWLTGHSIPQG